MRFSTIVLYCIVCAVYYWVLCYIEYYVLNCRVLCVLYCFAYCVLSRFQLVDLDPIPGILITFLSDIDSFSLF